MDPNQKEEVTSKTKRPPFKSQGATNFPAKLYVVLESMEKDGQQDIMGWQPHGRAFIIRDKSRLVAQILPAWFRQTRFSSFQRQLNLYGFIRIYKGPDHGAYYHPNFLRDHPLQAHAMERVPVKGRRLPGKERSFPDFYDNGANQARRESAAMTQSSSSSTHVVPVNNSNLQMIQPSTAPLLQGCSMPRMMRHSDALEMSAANILFSRYVPQTRIPITTVLPSNPLPFYCINAEIQQTNIEAYLREMALLSSIRQSLSRR